MDNKDVIPLKDAEFDSFQENLITVCTANAVAWNIVPGALTALTPLQAAWAAAWLVAKIKPNRTPAQVATKNVARKEYTDLLRIFIQSQIYLNPAVSYNDIVLCGLKPRDNTKSPVPVPTSVPDVDLETLPGNVLGVRFSKIDPVTGAVTRGKPNGVVRIEFAYNYTTEPATPEDCSENGTATRSPLRINVSPALRGQKVWYYARWINTREEPGPWTPLDFYVF